MITIKEIKENIKCPQFGDINYGKWGMLKLEQRLAYKKLIEQIESADNVIKSQYKEIERLNNNWNELRKWVVNNKHNENTEERYLVVDYGTLLGKMNELKGVDKE